MFSEFKSNIARRLNLVYAYAVATILLAAIVFRMQYVSPKYGDFNIIIHSVICIQQALITLTIVAIFYQSIWHPHRMDAVFQMLTKVDRAFAQFNVHIDYGLFRWKIWIEIIVLSASVHIAFAALCTHFGIDPFAAIIYELLARFYPIFVVNAALLMFINLCCLIKSKFTALKKMLLDFRDIDTVFSAGSDEVWKVKLVQTMPPTFYGELKRIANVYELLHDIVNRLNDIFGLTNLASLTLLAISLTCHLFLLVKLLMENRPSIEGICFELFGVVRNCAIRDDSILIQRRFFFGLVSAIWMLLLLAYITIICHLTIVEANAISALVHETLTKHEMDEAMFIDVSCCQSQYTYYFNSLNSMRMLRI